MNGRPAIARRSCDQCRARKIGCDRASPCSNCLSARVDCTHSLVATKPAASKQRVLISAEYERKIDGIVHNVHAIKRLLEENIPSRVGNNTSASTIIKKPILGAPKAPQVGGDTFTPLNSSPGVIPLWDHSAHVIDFVKDIIDRNSVKDQNSNQTDSSSIQVISSLKNLLSALENPEIARGLRPIGETAERLQENTQMPPLESVVEILRWSKAHANYTRIVWICKVLPLEKFEEICCKVYFAVNDNTEAEFIIANGFLSYVFAEHMAIYGVESSREFSYQCRANLDISLPRLPLLLPASMEIIAALTLGALHSIEDSRASRAWTLISSALSLCQTLRYHRLGLTRGDLEGQRSSQASLFWVVYSLEGGLSLRLGRSSGIQDTDIILPIDPSEPRPTKVARIQRKVYNQLYSPGALSSPAETRAQVARQLSREIQAVIEESRFEISNIAHKLSESEENAMRMVYLHCGWVCQSSLLVLILRAIPITEDADISRNCLTAARETFDIHQQCMKIVRACKDPLLVTKYITWALLHTPFVSFSIIFSHAVCRSDMEDLMRLDDFAASLGHEAADRESHAHPYQLYHLLCQAARLHIECNAYTSRADANSADNNPDLSDSPAQPSIIAETEIGMQALDAFDYSMVDLGDWYYGNQQLMGLLDEDMKF